jgi:hypothetical protein
MGKRSKSESLQHWPDRMLDWLNDEVLMKSQK